MTPPPTDPQQLRAHAFDALCADIADTGSPTFKRMDALREVLRQTKEKRA